MKTDIEIIDLTVRKVFEFETELDRDISAHLLMMLKELRKQWLYNTEEEYNPEKVNRWIGFVHGQLVALTDCTVDELRDLCR